jgi:phosphopantetheinyl transferase (holo-ACP synthase)
MQVTKKRLEFLRMLTSLKGLGNIAGFKVSYAIMRIKTVLEREVKVTKDLAIPSKEWEALDNKRDEIAKTYAKKDALGKPVTIKNGMNLEYDMTPEDQVAMDKAYEELKKEHADVWEARQEQKKRVDESFMEEITLDFHDIKKADLPENITVNQLEILAPFISDLEE